MSVWKRGLCPTNLDLDAYLPKPVKKQVNNFVEFFQKEDLLPLRNYVKKREKFMAAMLVYAVHQCCKKDKLKACEKLIDLIENDAFRTRIVNGQYGRSGYSPLCRAAFCGSERMLKFLISCNADCLYKNKHGEGIVDILNVGLQEAIRDSKFTQVEVKKNKKGYTLVFPSPNPKMVKTVHVNDLSAVTFRKWDKPENGWVMSKSFGINTDNEIFIKERFARCRKYIEDEVRWQQAKSNMQRSSMRRKKKYLGKRVAALLIQEWWHKNKVNY